MLLKRRTWPIVVSCVYVVLGLLFSFRWGPVVQHLPSQWLRPDDLGAAYMAASDLAHGHFGAIYTHGFLAYPGLLLVLAPLTRAGLGGSFIEIATNHHLLTHPVPYIATSNLLKTGSPFVSGRNEYVLHPDALVTLIPAALVLSCVALFACDALAERLQVSQTRRVVLLVAEAVLLWNVTVFWGHPEDPVAVALAIYALIFAMDERFTGAGWLFGAALVFQPLVIVMFPVLLFLVGKDRAFGLIVRGVVPAAVVTVVPLVANFHDTFHALVTQPTFPLNTYSNHQTPWTFLAQKQGGGGAVGAGPMRIPVLALAVGVGWWARRWRHRPEMLAWAVAVTFALRLLFEVTMTDYYIWPALAVGLVVAARCSQLRFAVSIAVAILTTVVAQWRIGWLPWWSVDVAGVALLLAIASRPAPLVPAGKQASQRRRTAVAVQGTSSSGAQSAMTGATRRTRSPSVGQVRTKSGSQKKRPQPGKKRSKSH